MRTFPLLLIMMISLCSNAQNDSLSHTQENSVRHDNFNADVDPKKRMNLFFTSKVAPTMMLMPESTNTAQPFFLTEEMSLELAPKSIVYETSSEKKVYFDNIEAYSKVRRLSGPTQFDSRLEMHQLDPSISWQNSLLQQCESVAIIIEKENISQITGDYYYLNSAITLGKRFNLCPQEPFYGQVILGGGTGFIVSENTMLTAKHVFQRPIKDYRVVFGFRLLYANGVTETFFEASAVFEPVALVNEFGELDVVEFSVGRNFNRRALALGNSFSNKKNDEVYMIGHPCGLPLKISLNATISDNAPSQFFLSTLDSFMGNSGSPIFDFVTNEVIGILVSGEVDFQSNGDCNYSPVCKMPYCSGEKAIRIDAIRQFR